MSRWTSTRRSPSPEQLSEGRRWLERALEEADSAPQLLRRQALTAAASFALLQGEYEVATAFAEESLEAARATGEPRYVANALSNLGAIVLAAGDQDRAGVVLPEAVDLAREVGDERIAALAINNLGDLALTLGDLERAEPLFEELKLGRLDDAGEHFRESLSHGREAGDKEDLAWCLEGFAALAAASGQGKRAALLLGAAEALLSGMGADFKPFERHLHETTETQARALCGDDVFATAASTGAGMALDEALEAALGTEAAA